MGGRSEEKGNDDGEWKGRGGMKSREDEEEI
jgi:hypothetical protein